MLFGGWGERQSEVNGKSPFGVVTNHEMLGELSPLDPLGLMGAKCQLSGPIIGKTQVSQMEEDVVLNRNKQTKKYILFIRKYTLRDKKKDIPVMHIKV